MTKIRRQMAALLAAVLCLSLLLVSVGAYVRVDTGAKTSLTMNYVDESRQWVLKGMELRLYRVADMTDAVRFRLTEAFSRSGADLEDLQDMDADKWSAMAETLAAYVAADQARGEEAALIPAAEGTVGEDGTVTFRDLPVGLYLLVGDTLWVGSYRYIPNSFLCTLPALNVETDEWLYDVKAANKFSCIPPGGSTSISLNVMKVWKDDENADRPAQVTVQLLRDGAVYDTVHLNEGNDWRHSWNRLDKNSRWQLIEVEVPEHYTVLVEREGNTFVVTNTREEELEEPPVPTGSEPSENIPDEPVPGGGLPQTGTLWWPVQLLGVLGILLFFVGWLDRRRGKKDAYEA